MWHHTYARVSLNSDRQCNQCLHFIAEKLFIPCKWWVFQGLPHQTVKGSLCLCSRKGVYLGWNRVSWQAAQGQGQTPTPPVHLYRLFHKREENNANIKLLSFFWNINQDIMFHNLFEFHKLFNVFLNKSFYSSIK